MFLFHLTFSVTSRTLASRTAESFSSVQFLPFKLLDAIAYEICAIAMRFLSSLSPSLHVACFT